jgi:hypothetical protein
MTALRGVPPSVFDGTRHKSEFFLREFKRYKRLNCTNDIMTNPYNRVIIALSYIKGPNIDTWVDAQETLLDARVNANPQSQTPKKSIEQHSKRCSKMPGKTPSKYKPPTNNSCSSP